MLTHSPWGIWLQSHICKLQTHLNDKYGIFCEIAIMKMPQYLTDHKSTFVQVMACCRQAITWANVDLDPCRHMTSLGHNEVIIVDDFLNIDLSSLSDTIPKWPSLMHSVTSWCHCSSSSGVNKLFRGYIYGTSWVAIMASPNLHWTACRNLKKPTEQ